MMQSPVFCLILGVIVGALVVAGTGWLLITKKFEKVKYVVQLENIILIFAVLIFVSALILDFGLHVSGIISILLSTAGSFLGSYILSKKFSKITYEEKLKEQATTAYRHNKSLLSKLEYQIQLIEDVFVLENCKREGENCRYLNILYRIRDSLIAYKQDMVENISDWSVIIPEETLAIDQIVKQSKRIKALRFKRENEDLNIEEATRIDEEIIKVEKILEEQRKILSDKPTFELIVSDQESLSTELNERVRKEKRMKQVRKIQNKNYNVILNSKIKE